MMFSPYLYQDKSIGMDVDEIITEVQQLSNKLVALRARVTRAEIDRESLAKQVREFEMEKANVKP